MNKNTILNCLNNANIHDLIQINVFTKPFAFEKKYIIYGLDDDNTLFIKDKEHDINQYIKINSIKSISIIKNFKMDYSKQINKAIAVKKQLEENLIKSSV